MKRKVQAERRFEFCFPAAARIKFHFGRIGCKRKNGNARSKRKRLGRKVLRRKDAAILRPQTVHSRQGGRGDEQKNCRDVFRLDFLRGCFVGLQFFFCVQKARFFYVYGGIFFLYADDGFFDRGFFFLAEIEQFFLNGRIAAFKILRAEPEQTYAAPVFVFCIEQRFGAAV